MIGNGIVGCGSVLGGSPQRRGGFAWQFSLEWPSEPRRLQPPPRLLSRSLYPKSSVATQAFFFRAVKIAADVK